jgi:hypothetical protein
VCLGRDSADANRKAREGAGSDEEDEWRKVGTPGVFWPGVRKRLRELEIVFWGGRRVQKSGEECEKKGSAERWEFLALGPGRQAWRTWSYVCAARLSQVKGDG